MGYGHMGISMSATQFVKPCIAQFAGSHFDADTLTGSILVCIKMSDMKLYAQCLTKGAAKGFVAIALLTPQMEVAMGRMTGISQSKEHTQKGHTVGSATESHKQCVRRSEKCFALHKLFYLPFKMSCQFHTLFLNKVGSINSLCRKIGV